MVKDADGDKIRNWRGMLILFATCVGIGGGLFTLELWSMEQMSVRDAALFHAAPNCGNGQAVNNEIKPCRVERGIIVEKYVVRDIMGPRSEYIVYRNEIGYNQDALLTTPGFYGAMRIGGTVNVTWWHGPVLSTCAKVIVYACYDYNIILLRQYNKLSLGKKI